MGGFDIDTYNSLYSIAAAEARFHQQLALAQLPLSKFLDKLAPLFLEEANKGLYAACLIHRHHILQAGERMVSDGRSTRPLTSISSNIIPERWLSTGEEVEHRFIDSTSIAPFPPSFDFLSKLRAILDDYSIDTIGLCYAPTADELTPGFVFLESAGIEDRELVVDIVPESSMASHAKTFQSAWVPDFGGNTRSIHIPTQQKSVMRCTHSCVGCPP